MNSRRSDPKFVQSYERGMLRSAFKSLFWAIISEKKKREAGFTMMKLARDVSTSKHEVSRWFNGDPNWTINTIANLASALNVDVEIRAIDRRTGAVFLPSGMQATPVRITTSVQPRPMSMVGIPRVSAPSAQRRVTVTRVPDGSSPNSVSAAAA
jgi:DNA-binding phage protein